MHEQAQLRLRKDEVEKRGAEVYVVVVKDLYRTEVFKDKNVLLPAVAKDSPFSKEKSLVFGTALSDPAGYASALYGVSRRAFRRSGNWFENDPTWFVIDRRGTITYAAHPTFSSPTSYVEDVDRMLEALKRAAE